MTKKYFKCGERPIIVEAFNDYKNYKAMNWETGNFEQNFRYAHQIAFDPSGDVEQLSKSEFEEYVSKLKSEIDQND